MKKKTWIVTAAALCAVMVFAGACARKEDTQTTASQTQQEETTQAETETETEPETTQSQTEEAMEDRYHMLQGTIIRTDQDGMVFTLQADDGETYDISLTDIRDVETAVEADTHIAIAYIGDKDFDLDSAQMIVALPEQEEWTISQVTGTTLSNAMSSFSIETEDGQQLQFLKDNCPIEEDALSRDSGDEIQVFYVASHSLNMNFPIEILKAR